MSNRSFSLSFSIHHYLLTITSFDQKLDFGIGDNSINHKDVKKMQIKSLNCNLVRMVATYPVLRENP